MSIKKFCLLVLVCFLGLTSVFAGGRQDVSHPQAASGSNNGINIQGNKIITGGFTYGAVLNEDSYDKLPLQTQITGPLISGTRGQSNSPLPKSFSLKEFTPIPGEQGDIGSCTGWAAAYGAKTILESITLERTNRFLTTKNAYSPLYCYEKARELDEWSDEIEGANITTVVSLMSEFGVPKNFEYMKLNASLTGGSKDGSSRKADNLRKTTIRGVTRLIHNKDRSSMTMQDRITRIKNNIRQGNPVIVGMYPDDSFITAGEQWKPNINAVPNPHNGHAVCVIGYDDNKFGGAFEILNSWSEYWGNGGFTWIDYATFDKYLAQASVIIDDISSYDNPFEWTGGITVQTEGNNRNVPVRLSEDGIYTSKTSLKTGTQFRFVLEGNNRSANGPIYPYVFYADKTLGKTVQVWPTAGNAVKIENGKPLTIPANNQWIAANGSVSADCFIFLFSRKELDFTSIRNSFERQRGSVMERLNTAIGENKFIPAAYGLYEFSNIKSIVDFLDMDSVMGIVFSTQYDRDGNQPLDMVKISGGSFTMGSPRSDPYYSDDERQKTVRVSDFYIGSAPITVGEFKEFAASVNYKTSAERNGQSVVFNRNELELEMTPKYNWSNPSYTQDDTYPVVHISWVDAMEYCNWRSKQEGFKPVYTISGGRVNIDNSANGYRLPTEAEWEYACRAGTNTPYNTGGNSISPVTANYIDSFNLKPVPVRNYSPNRWGLYDMHGNIYEWTQDFYDNDGNVSVRGGAWCNPEPVLRSAFRGWVGKDITYAILGFRLVRADK
jgi:formylglycine-generating enzyme required for sulfatase activity